MRKGYGLFFYDCDTKKEEFCNVCGTKMKSERYLGATSFAGAMSGAKTSCDRFWCPHIKDEWHDKAVSILEESDRTASPSLQKLLLKDVKKIVHKGLMGL
jgi:hypothetical protein